VHHVSWPNPSWDFIEWLRDNGLAQAPKSLAGMVFGRRSDVAVAPIGDVGRTTKAEVQLLLGDARGARRTYAGALLLGRRPLAAARGVVEVTVNHGSRPTAALLAVASTLPPVGRLRAARSKVLRKRLNILFNVGRHYDVVRLTASRREVDVSTLGILRAAALRMTGDLDEAVEQATVSLAKAKQEEHRPRIANAAYQLVFALMWAGRLEEAEARLDDALRPYAELTTTRWVAWSDFLAAALHVHAGRGAAALALCADALARFEGEGLVDGLVSTKLVELTARRCSSDPDGFTVARGQLDDLLGRRGATYYTRGNRFTAEAVSLEDGEFARVHARDLGAAEAAFAFVARSEFGIHAALGNLGLAAVKLETRDQAAATHHAAAARREAQRINARLVVARADELEDALSGKGGPFPEVFFP
jgi:tetratricopeptide (TPR) repeat protein